MFYTVPRWNLIHIHLNMFRWYENKYPRLHSDRIYCCNLLQKFQNRNLVKYNKNNWKKEGVFFCLPTIFCTDARSWLYSHLPISFKNIVYECYFFLPFGYIVIDVFVKYWGLFSNCKTTPNTHRLRQNVHECIRNPKLTLFKQLNHCIKLRESVYKIKSWAWILHLLYANETVRLQSFKISNNTDGYVYLMIEDWRFCCIGIFEPIKSVFLIKNIYSIWMWQNCV